MPRKIPNSRICDAAQLVLNGCSVEDASSTIPMHPLNFVKRAKQLGFRFPRKSPSIFHEKLDPFIEDIISMYQDGKSENAIAKKFGVSRNAIRKRILDSGIKPRTQSEAESLKWSQMSDKARANQLQAAHNAATGRKRTIAERASVAAAREKLKYDHLIGVGETEFGELLTNAGIQFVSQKAVYTYNLDFAIGNVAVELTADRGRYSMFNPKEIKRAKHLFKRGYHVLAVQFDDVRSLIKAFDYILTNINKMSGLKPCSREYWVVSCRRQTSIVVHADDGKFTTVHTPEDFINKTSVIYF